jgi:preprotein translocase subunit SecA
MNRQREAIYSDRRHILEGDDISGTFQQFMEQVVTEVVRSEVTDTSIDDWDLPGLWNTLSQIYPVGLEVEEVLEEARAVSKASVSWLVEEILSDARLAYERRTQEVGEQVMRELERRVMLSVIDRKWRDHLYEMDYLKEGIGLRAMAQRDPLVEYQREGYNMFSDMMAGIREEAVQFLFNVEIKQTVTEVQPQPIPAGLTMTAPSEQGIPQQVQQKPAPKTDGKGSSFFRN